jgi:nucleoside-diphosphate-sugar epimerase
MTSFDGRRLVIFGCGYVGQAVAGAAQARGACVTALTRNPETAAALRAQGIEVVVGDLAGEAWHGFIPGRPDFLLNSVSSGGGGIEAYRHSYVGGMASIVAWARRTGPAGTAVYTSSTSVYPQGDGASVDEKASNAGGTERAQLLLEAENNLRTAPDACARWFILRLAGIYGPGRHYLADQVAQGEVAGIGEHRLNLIHRDDAAAAILACFLAPPGIANEVFNLADDDPTRKSDVATWLAERLGHPVPRFTGESHGTRRPVAPDRIIVNQKIKSVLGWTPQYPSFREGYASFLSR